ncbi:NnrS family protein, partial [Candidatus Skiveiella danica]
GRALVADNTVWGLFWTLQLATVLRITGAVPGAPGGLILVAALVWAMVMAVWGVRYGSWFGRLRVDGKPG